MIRELEEKEKKINIVYVISHTQKSHIYIEVRNTYN